jgi:putative ABC transport system permease protein
MANHYVKSTLRSLLKNKVFTLINIIGLSIGTSAALVIYLIVQYDLNFDKFEPSRDHIYRQVQIQWQ